MNQIIGGTTIRLHQDDNVVVAAQNIGAGATIPGEGVVTASPVPSGHKIATRAITAGDYVRKYNQIIGVVTTVNCSATVAKRVAAAFENGGLEDHPNVDGVVALVHGTGCGMATKGEGFDVLQRILWGYLRHPNFAGVLLIGLG